MSIKQEVIEMLAQLPDEATLEDIQYHVNLFFMVEQRRKEADAGKTVSQEEARERLQRWLK
jgi:hypothetical protein